jgi:photosystem II stability/assembly factor-like uncharacterized protein
MLNKHARSKTLARPTSALSRKKGARSAVRKGPLRAPAQRVLLLVGTRKGAFFLESDGARTNWTVKGPHLLGNIVNHVVLDPRDGRTILMAAKTGHLGPTVFRSTDWGKTWTEAKRPPAFPKSESAPAGGAPEGASATGDGKGLVLDQVFWLSAGHASEPDVWWAGSVPHGLFRSEDAGATWELATDFETFRAMKVAGMSPLNATPGGAITHSVLIDPRDARHMYVGLSTGGCFESTNGGRDWKPLNRGVSLEYYPEEARRSEVGHDPHCIVLSPASPDRLYQQNHCGIYRIDRPGDTWERIGDNMPRAIRDIGFPIVAHPRNPDTVWVFPMDGTEVWPRTSVGGKPAVYKSTNGGRKWARMDAGFPRTQGWFTVFRQAFVSDAHDPVGLYVGTTGGEVWQSRDEGASWSVAVRHLPDVHAISVGRPR